MALNRVWMPSPNYSSRGGTGVRLIVLHTTEGASTIESLGNWFANPANQVSSHTGADDKPNTVGEYVKRDQKAWTAANANPYSVQLEMCAYAAWTADQWAQHPTMLANAAAWIAEEAQAFGIPIVKLTAGQAQGGGTGVCQHADLGAAGGGHWDCGSGFPIDQVIAMAQGGGPPPARQQSANGSEDSTVSIITAPGRVDLFVIGTDHGVYQAMGTDMMSLAGADWGRLGGDGTTAKAVSASWSPDYKTLYLGLHGTDDVAYVGQWDGRAWSDFVPNGKGQLNPDPYGA